MTKKSIAEKLRHYSTLLAASLFAFVCLCPSIGFSDGTCYLEQSPNGQYVIRCEGDGLWFNYVDKTNEVYVIENCEVLKSQLVSSVDSISDSICDSRTNYLHSAIGSLYGVENLVSDLNGDNKDVAISSLQDVRSDLLRMDSSLDGVDDSLSSLRSRILSIQCGSCPTNGVSGDGSCCDVDLTPILDNLNDAQRLRVSMTNYLELVSSVLSGTLGFRTFRSYVNLGASSSGVLYAPNGSNLKRFGSKSTDNNILNNLNIINENLAMAGGSINNYLYKIGFFDLPSISNNVEHLYIESTNFFSFFRSSVGVKSVLGDYGGNGPYYDFLTNHYIKVSRGDFSGMSDSQLSKTNWFARIETLIASLVFADSVESTNTVDSAQAESESSNILSEAFDGVDDVRNISSSQLSVFRDTSQNVVSSLRSISSSFSSATDPGTITLVRFSSSDTRDSLDSVSFETSDIRTLVEACHCVTTLCWCLGGLFLLYSFLHWTVKTSYSLVVFAWGVFSAIFKH